MVDVIGDDARTGGAGDDGTDGLNGTDGDAGSTARDEQRAALSQEIKAVARRHLAPRRGGSLSLRAVAREVGMVPSGIYRYFDSRDALVAAVAEDVAADAAAALGDALEDAAAAPYLDQALAMAVAHRRWCLEQRTDFALLLGPDLGGHRGLLGLDRLTAMVAMPLRHYADGLAAGLVDRRGGRRRPRGGAVAVTAYRSDLDPGPDLAGTRLRPEHLGCFLDGWLRLSGLVWMELFGPLADLHEDPDAAWVAEARAVLVGIGYREPVSAPARPGPRIPGRS